MHLLWKLLFFVILSQALATTTSRPRYDNLDANESEQLVRLKLTDAIANVVTSLPQAIVESIPSLPSFGNILNWTKQTVIGKPFELAFATVRRACSKAIRERSIRPSFRPGSNDLKLKLRTIKSNVSLSLSDPKELFKRPEYDSSKGVVIFVCGWSRESSTKDEAMHRLYDAYKCRDEFNFLTLESGSYIDEFTTLSAFNAPGVGRALGEAIAVLAEDIPTKNIHLIGHSLGAHVAGIAGRRLTEIIGKKLERITGLDPAYLCFNDGEGLKGLHRGDAEFVDVIHSNPSVLGIPSSIGDADFYPNGRDLLRPGCLDVLCAHFRSVHYFAETVYPGNEHNFLATECSSIGNLKSCNGPQIPMGLFTPKDIHGNFFLETYGQWPFGRDAKPGNVPQCSPEYNLNKKNTNE